MLNLSAENPRMQKDSQTIAHPWPNDILLYCKDGSLGFADEYC